MSKRSVTPERRDLEHVTDAAALHLEERALVGRERDPGDDDALVLRGPHRDLHAFARAHAHEQAALAVERDLARRRRIRRRDRDDVAGLRHVVRQDLVVREAGRAPRGEHLGHREEGLLHGRGRVERRQRRRTCAAARLALLFGPATSIVSPSLWWRGPVSIARSAGLSESPESTLWSGFTIAARDDVADERDVGAIAGERKAAVAEPEVLRRAVAAREDLRLRGARGATRHLGRTRAPDRGRELRGHERSLGARRTRSPTDAIEAAEIAAGGAAPAELAGGCARRRPSDLRPRPAVIGRLVVATVLRSPERERARRHEVERVRRARDLALVRDLDDATVAVATHEASRSRRTTSSSRRGSCRTPCRRSCRRPCDDGASRSRGRAPRRARRGRRCRQRESCPLRGS